MPFRNWDSTGGSKQEKRVNCLEKRPQGLTTLRGGDRGDRWKEKEKRDLAGTGYWGGGNRRKKKQVQW